MAEPARGAYRELVRAQIRSQSQYRASFAMDAALTSCVSVLEILAILVLFRVTPSLGGFSVREAVLIAALCEFAFQIADLAVGNIERIAEYVRTGRMDTVLVRPLSPLGQLLAGDFPLRKAGRVVQGLALYAAALVYAGIDWTPARALLAVTAPVAAGALFAAAFVAGATVAFFWIDSGEFANAFTYGGRTFGTYPQTIYPAWMRVLFGYGFAGYQPALALLGRPDPLGTPAWVAWCTPLAAAAAWVGAVLMWRTGVRHYRSTGS
ncbi:ABC transporter permease [Yinghuangia soli]|uniref:ABC-2 family transporter protein n=1 Tax=Yinghuangia soli TaxID=2908204 RepID=A0AA41TYF3_9ACTN|nr:ABC-2 family transporter protein [Yinghuangia soli]MCF2526336.1 ABC-2 family transporter protein [Yinghuangia soli]